MITRRTFRAMGTDVACLVESAAPPRAREALDAAEAEFRRLEAALSRFRPDSELSRLNREGAIAAGPDLLRVVERALAGRERSGGRFDPTVYDAVVAAGYDRPLVELGAEAGPAAPGAPARCGGAVRIDSARGTIELDPGVALDLGGIAKGDAVDRACELLGHAGPCLVNAGGDLAVRGTPAGGVWPVAVETPAGSVTLAIRRGGLATSGSDRRRWTRGGELLHHLIDPATGRPAASDLVRVTVAAASATEAEVLAKSLFLAGERAAAAECARARTPGVLITADGRAILAGGLA
ncbi:MAG: FAD:protein FMN transferase [Thermoleophilia bacterium]|nr:FAD:protein FMN transferase [Thermoleophilia bacterium]